MQNDQINKFMLKVKATPADDALFEKIAYDFNMLDCWKILLYSESNDELDLDSILQIVMAKPQHQGIMDKMSSFLFGFREFLGKYFGWDKDMNSLPIPGCEEISLRDRLRKLKLDSQVEVDLALSSSVLVKFLSVYSIQNEKLYEISNNTVHALMRYKLLKATDGKYQLELSVYVKTRGWLGRFYMGLIKPFRHLIIYPTLVKNAENNWKRHLVGKRGV